MRASWQLGMGLAPGLRANQASDRRILAAEAGHTVGTASVARGHTVGAVEQ
eukprot:SAG31_NODE_27090_length_431_cov_1.240964_1_plen_50_part_01